MSRASLHALSCNNDPCTCSPMYGWVQESEAVEQAFDVKYEYVGEAADNVESRTAGLSRFPERSGRLRSHEGEAS